MSGLTERNRCPRCSSRPHLMPGVLTPAGKVDETYLVCWRDNLVKLARDEAEWMKFTKKKAAAIEWKKFSPVHWQTMVKGQVLDYWPTKRKWRFGNKTRTGDVLGFIRSVSGSTTATEGK